MYTQEVDMALRAHVTLLKKIFKAKGGDLVGPKEKQAGCVMSLEEFQESSRTLD